MPVYRDEAVVLRTHKLGEADRIVTLLTRNHGKVRAVAKGVRRTGSKFGARLEPFMVADVQLYEGRSLDIITQAESLGSYGALITADYPSYTAASVMVETADKLTEAEGSLQQYLLLVGALRSLSRAEHGSHLTLNSYLLRAVSMAGWAPSFHDCARCGAVGYSGEHISGDHTTGEQFASEQSATEQSATEQPDGDQPVEQHSAMVVQMGGIVCDSCAPSGSPRLDSATIALLSALLTGDWEHAESTPDRTQSQAAGVVAAYTQWHLGRGLRSLEHVAR